MSGDVARGHNGNGGGGDCPLHVRYPPVFEARALENLTGEARKPIDSIPACKPGTSGDRHGDPDALRFLVQDPDRAEGLTMWKASNPDIPRTFPRHIGMRRLAFGLILKTLPEPLKINKTRQRAWSYAGRDPSYLLSSKICRWRAPTLERGDVEAQGSMPQHATSVPYTNDEIMA
ncbi:hypothetical protein Tco_1564523, partial [Tanacetum coccineum]